MKKQSLFVQIFSGFLVGIALFTIILFVFFRMGLSSAIDRWEEDSIASLKDIAIQIILEDGDMDTSTILIDEPLFVYDINKLLIYSNRGSGRRNTIEKDYLPLVFEDKLIGYLYTIKIHFMDNKANERFSETINEAILFALFFSTIIVLLLSLFITKRISHPAKQIAQFLEKLSDGGIGHQMNIYGANEINQISLAVNDLSKKLEHEGNIRRQWSSDIAHDLRTPVSALKAQFEAMSQGVLGINLKRVNQNLHEILRMELLIEDLSELMRLEEPEIKLFSGEVDSEEFIKQITSRNMDELKSRGIQLIIENEVESFNGDEMLLHRAISNIWNNAIRHTNDSGFIKISINGNAAFVSISIKNSGDVISHEDLHRVFDRLYRGEIARESKGSGLGLTIAKKIIELHQGSISLTSDIDKGTIFIIKIPN